MGTQEKKIALAPENINATQGVAMQLVLNKLHKYRTDRNISLRLSQPHFEWKIIKGKR